MSALSTALLAQAPSTEDKRTARDSARARASNDALALARTLARSGDTTTAVRILREATERDNQNGPLWYELGSLLSAKTRPHWRKGLMPNGIPSLIIAAETSLALAMRLSPDSVGYAVDYAKHLWSTNTTSLRMATRVQERAFEKLGEGSDSSALAESADQLGIMLWRRYEPAIARRVYADITQRPDVRASAEAMATYLAENKPDPQSERTRALYDEAVRYFHLASETDPDVQLYFRHEMVALSEARRWQEVRLAATSRLRERPAQAWPWLILGLSEHWLGRQAAASVAFDSGFARLDPADRERMLSIQRLIPTRRVKMFDTLSVELKSTFQEQFWNFADPSMLIPGNTFYDEFRARVVYAELRFADDEKGRNGADTHQGEVYIRYGPPDRMGSSTTNGATGMTWTYLREHLQFTFTRNWGYGTSFYTSDSHTLAEQVAYDRAVGFMNVPELRRGIDSISAQVARFRSRGDSIDVAVFAALRPGALRRGSPVDSSVILHGVILVNAMGEEITRAATKLVTAERDTLAMLPREFVVRTTADMRAARVEAADPDIRSIARSVMILPEFETNGFGVSDLLIAAKVEQPSGREAARWNEFRITPLVGSIVARGAPLHLLWESYESAKDGGKSRLRYAVSVQRETEKGFIAISSRVLTGLRGAITGARRNDELTVTYDREFAALPVLVDGLNLDVGQLEPGRYRVSLAVTDLLRNSTATRVQRFMIVR